MTITIPTEAVRSNVNRLTNQMWKLIPMRENNENWHDQLETIYIELAGLISLSSNAANEKTLVLLSKIQGMRNADTTFQIYRKTVFECISLLREMRL